MTCTIMEDIHNIRDEYAKRFDNDLMAICKDAQKRQGLDGREIISVHIKLPVSSIGRNAIAVPPVV